MINADVTQEPMSERVINNTQAFKDSYKRLNFKQQQKEQKNFCAQFDISRVLFRAKLAGGVRVSESELVFMLRRVATYFS